MKEVVEIRSKFNNLDIGDIVNLLDELGEEYKGVIESLEDRIEELERELEDSARDIEILEDEVQDLRDEISNLNETIEGDEDIYG